jgi:hypothetical protein
MARRETRDTVPAGLVRGEAGAGGADQQGLRTWGGLGQRLGRHGRSCGRTHHFISGF